MELPFGTPLMKQLKFLSLFSLIMTYAAAGSASDTADAPQYLGDNLAAVHAVGVLKDTSRDA